MIPGGGNATLMKVCLPTGLYLTEQLSGCTWWQVEKTMSGTFKYTCVSSYVLFGVRLCLILLGGTKIVKKKKKISFLFSTKVT